MKPNKTVLLSGVLVALLAASAVPGHATLTAVSYSDYGQGSSADNNVTGWDFTTANTIVITGLGFYDNFGNDLTAIHDVGIYSTGSAGPAGTLLGLGSVGPGDTLVGSAPHGFFRFRNLSTTFTLAPGTYRIAATDNNETWVFSSTANPYTSLSIASGITIGNSYQAVTTSLSYPTALSGNSDAILSGPNFQFVAIPEPSTVMLFGLGGFLLARIRQWTGRS